MLRNSGRVGQAIGQALARRGSQDKPLQLSRHVGNTWRLDGGAYAAQMSNRNVSIAYPRRQRLVEAPLLSECQEQCCNGGRATSAIVGGGRHSYPKVRSSVAKVASREQVVAKAAPLSNGA